MFDPLAPHTLLLLFLAAPLDAFSSHNVFHRKDDMPTCLYVFCLCDTNLMLLSLLGQIIPQLQWSFAIRTEKAADKVIFKLLYRSLCCIYSVVVWLQKLPFALFCFQKCLQWSCCLVVRHVQHRFVPVLFHFIKYLLHCLHYCFVFKVTHFLCLDEVIIIIIRHDIILMLIKGQHVQYARRVSIHRSVFCLCQRCETEHVTTKNHTL